MQQMLHLVSNINRFNKQTQSSSFEKRSQTVTFTGGFLKSDISNLALRNKEEKASRQLKSVV